MLQGGGGPPHSCVCACSFDSGNECSESTCSTMRWEISPPPPPRTLGLHTMDGGVSNGMQELLETSQRSFMGMLICVNKKYNNTEQKHGIMYLQDSKKMAQGDKVLILPVVNGFIPLFSLAGCVHVIPPARWVKATWNVTGRSWRGLTVKAFWAVALTTRPVHFLHFDESWRRLHWFAGSPLKLRPLSSRWGRAPWELQSPKRIWHAANATGCLSVLLRCPLRKIVYMPFRFVASRFYLETDWLRPSPTSSVINKEFTLLLSRSR